MVFVNSMSDLFHQDVPEEYIKDIVRIMLLANWHTYQILTKRSTRMCEMLRTSLRDAADAPQIWWGVSVENRRDGLPRADELRAAAVRVRFLSVEPLLEDLGPFDLAGIHWVILGGESGPGARPLDKDWVIAIRDQCRRGGVPFFFKQWGGTRKGKNGRTLEGQTYDELPLRVVRPAPDEGRRKALLTELSARHSFQKETPTAMIQ
jgi:protein gp37